MTRSLIAWTVFGCLAAGLIALPADAQQRQAAAAPQKQLPDNAKVLKDVEYARVGDVSLKLDLYLPGKAEGAKPVAPPLLVWIHGGGWRYGDKVDCPLRWLVGKGYAVASINYRLSDVALFPAGVHDCKGAIRWLRGQAQKYGYDARRIGISGGSAGGHLVALLGTSAGVQELEGDVAAHTDQSSAVQAVVNFFGPTDFSKLAEQGHPEFTTSLVALWLGDPISGRKGRSLAALASPVTHVGPEDAPVLTIQGTKDPLVFVPQATALHEAYSKAGLDSTLEIIEGGGHGGPAFFDDERRAMIEAFFDKHLRS